MEMKIDSDIPLVHFVLTTLKKIRYDMEDGVEGRARTRDG